MKFTLEIPIEIKSEEVESKTVRSRKDGKEYLIRNQLGWVDLGKPYPQEIQISLELNQAPFPVGSYRLDPGCLYIGRYRDLSLAARIRLISVS